MIGWVNYSEGRGAYGVEAQYDEALSGETGRIVTAKNGDGTQMLYRYEDYYDATDGDNLTLTLDSAIQSYCESILKRASSSSRCRTAASASPWTPIRAKFWPGPTPPPTI